jgi:hypothetical protein
MVIVWSHNTQPDVINQQKRVLSCFRWHSREKEQERVLPEKARNRAQARKPRLISDFRISKTRRRPFLQRKNTLLTSDEHFYGVKKAFERRKSVLKP